MIFLTSEVEYMSYFVNVEAHMDEIKEYMPQFVFYQREKPALL